MKIEFEGPVKIFSGNRDILVDVSSVYDQEINGRQLLSLGNRHVEQYFEGCDEIKLDNLKFNINLPKNYNNCLVSYHDDFGIVRDIPIISRGFITSSNINIFTSLISNKICEISNIWEIWGRFRDNIKYQITH